MALLRYMTSKRGKTWTAATDTVRTEGSIPGCFTLLMLKLSDRQPQWSQPNPPKKIPMLPPKPTCELSDASPLKALPQRSRGGKPPPLLPPNRWSRLRTGTCHARVGFAMGEVRLSAGLQDGQVAHPRTAR